MSQVAFLSLFSPFQLRRTEFVDPGVLFNSPVLKRFGSWKAFFMLVSGVTHLPGTSGTVQKDKQNFSKEEFKTQAHFSVIKGKVSISNISPGALWVQRSISFGRVWHGLGDECFRRGRIGTEAFAAEGAIWALPQVGLLSQTAGIKVKESF